MQIDIKHPTDKNNVLENREFLIKRGFTEDGQGILYNFISFGVRVGPAELERHREDLVNLLLSLVRTLSLEEAVNKMDELLKNEK